jgi:hypothetical protein
MFLSGFICISLTTLLCSQELTDTTRPEGGVKLFEYPVFSTTEPGVQCGLYALFAASNSLGSQIPLGEALSGKSFQNKNGLSAADIAGIARRFGLQSCVYFNLAPATLTAAKGPVILLLDDSAGADGANHWVTFMGMRGDRVSIYDSISGSQEIPMAELVSRWNGTGVEISTGNESLVSNLRYVQLLITCLLFAPAVGFSFLV